MGCRLAVSRNYFCACAFLSSSAPQLRSSTGLRSRRTRRRRATTVTARANPSGFRGQRSFYDVWNPTVGTGSNAHTVLPNNTTTDLFCSAVSLLASGNALIVGGDLTVNGVRNYSTNKVEIFSPTQNTLIK